MALLFVAMTALGAAGSAIGAAPAGAVVKAKVYASSLDDGAVYQTEIAQSSSVTITYEYQLESIVGIRFTESGGELESSGLAQPWGRCANRTPSVVVCTGLSVNFVTVVAWHGADRITAGVPARILARDGNDTIATTQGGDVLAEGGTDRVTLTVPQAQSPDAYEDLMGGGEVSGGAGQDTVEYLGCKLARSRFGAIGGVRVTLDTGRDDGCVDTTVAGPLQRVHSFEKLIGSPADDFLTGSERSDVIAPGAGADQIDGGNHNHDFWAPGDTLSYENSSKRVEASLATRVAKTPALAETDVFTGIESLTGSTAGDTLEGLDAELTGLFKATSHLRGGKGNDVLRGGVDNEFLYGDQGADVVDGGGETDFLVEDVTGADAGDILDGGEDYDWVEYKRPARVITGPEGIQVAPGGVLGSDGVVVTLDDTANDGWPNEGDNVMVELIKGSDGSDRITGDEVDNIVEGNRGNDLIRSLAANDRLYGGPGDDTLDGGDDEDTCYGDFATSSATDVLANCEKPQSSVPAPPPPGGVDVPPVEGPPADPNEVVELVRRLIEQDVVAPGSIEEIVRNLPPVLPESVGRLIGELVEPDDGEIVVPLPRP